MRTKKAQLRSQLPEAHTLYGLSFWKHEMTHQQNTAFSGDFPQCRPLSENRHQARALLEGVADFFASFSASAAAFHLFDLACAEF